MDKMTFYNDVLIGLYGKLWPRSPLTEVEMSQWFASLRGYGFEVIDLALRRHYTASRFSPKLAEIVAACRSITGGDKPRAINGCVDLTAQRRANEAHWRAIGDRLARVSAADLERHKASAIAGDGRLAWMRGLPVGCRLWMSVIDKRLRDGLGPDDRWQVATCNGLSHRGDMSANDYAGAVNR